MPVCGLDFGTSNSAIGVVASDGAISLAPVEGQDVLIPSAIFFDFSERDAVQFGRAAIESYIAQHEGRLMRALNRCSAPRSSTSRRPCAQDASRSSTWSSFSSSI